MDTDAVFFGDDVSIVNSNGFSVKTSASSDSTHASSQNICTITAASYVNSTTASVTATVYSYTSKPSSYYATGNSKGTVQSTNASAYPVNGKQDNYYYIRR